RRYWRVLAMLTAIVAILVYLAADRLSPHESYSRTNYSAIEDDLYLGGMLVEPRPGTRAVLNVCETEDPYRAEVHRWQPIPDAAPAPDLDWLRAQVEVIAEQRQAGWQAVVPCHAGIIRDWIVLTGYSMFHK